MKMFLPAMSYVKIEYIMKGHDPLPFYVTITVYIGCISLLTWYYYYRIWQSLSLYQEDNEIDVEMLAMIQE